MAVDAFTKGVSKAEAEAEDKVRRLTSQVSDLDGRLRRGQELIDKQAAEVQLQIQGRKAEENARKKSDAALASAVARVKELETALSSAEENRAHKEMELKVAQDFIASNSVVVGDLRTTLISKEKAIESSVAEAQVLKKKLSDRESAMAKARDRFQANLRMVADVERQKTRRCFF